MSRFACVLYSRTKYQIYLLIRYYLVHHQNFSSMIKFEASEIDVRGVNGVI